MSYIFMITAIIAEVIATSALNASAGFTRLLPSLGALLMYGIAFYFLAMTLKTIPVGIVYAIWSGVGIVLISLVGFVVFKQGLDAPALTGMGMILAGVMVIRLFSKSAVH